MKGYLILTKITFGDFIRRPEVLIIGALGVLFIAGVSMVLVDDDLAKLVASGVKSSQGVDVQRSTFIEGGLVYAEIFTVIVTFLIGMNLIGSDVKSRAITLYLVKPVRRWEYLLGKFSGGVLLSLTFYFFYVLLLSAVLYASGSEIGIPFFRLLFTAILKIGLLYSLILLFVQRTPGFVAAFLGTAIYLGGYFATEFYVLSINAGTTIKFSSLAIYYFLPHMVAVSPGSIMDSSEGVSLFMRWGLVYGIMYSGLWLFGALKLFSRRAV